MEFSSFSYSIENKTKALVNNKLLSDVTFLVGSEKTESMDIN